MAMITKLVKEILHDLRTKKLKKTLIISTNFESRRMECGMKERVLL